MVLCGSLDHMLVKGGTSLFMEQDAGARTTLRCLSFILSYFSRFVFVGN